MEATLNNEVKSMKLKKVPAKESEGNGQNESLEANTSIKVMKSSVVSITITRLSNGKPSILWVKLSEMTHFL